MHKLNFYGHFFDGAKRCQSQCKGGPECPNVTELLEEGQKCGRFVCSKVYFGFSMSAGLGEFFKSSRDSGERHITKVYRAIN